MNLQLIRLRGGPGALHGLSLPYNGVFIGGDDLKKTGATLTNA